MYSNVKISVIIPVYNAKKYLKKCINSVLNQTHKNLEIIIIKAADRKNRQIRKNIMQAIKARQI